MPDHEALADVELDQVGAGRHRRRERFERVLGRLRRRAAVADHERAAARMAQIHLVRLNFDPMVEPASRLPAQGEELPSLDPAAIEQAYRRERARRRARVAHREYARNSNARFWVMLPSSRS